MSLITSTWTWTGLSTPVVIQRTSMSGYQLKSFIKTMKIQSINERYDENPIHLMIDIGLQFWNQTYCTLDSLSCFDRYRFFSQKQYFFLFSLFLRPAPKNEDEMMILIFEYIDRIFSIVRPRKLLYMAIDGVVCKMKIFWEKIAPSKI